MAGGLAAASVFTLLLGLATLLHWEKFNHDHVSFWAWLLLYVVSPFLLPVLALANWRAGRTDDGEPPDQPEIPSWARASLAGAGGASVLAAPTIFTAPMTAVERWP